MSLSPITNDENSLIISNKIHEIIIDPILTKDSSEDIVDTDLTNQFIVNSSVKLSLKSTKPPMSDQNFAALCLKMTTNIVDIPSIIQGSLNIKDTYSDLSISQSDSYPKEIPQINIDTITDKKNKKIQKKKLTKKDIIIMENQRNRSEKELNNIIENIKTNECDILNGELPSISSLEGIIHSYSRSSAIKIVKIIIFKSLVKRYINNGDTYIVPLIFEFYMLMMDIKDEWYIESISTPIVVTNEIKNHRKARLQLAKAQPQIIEFNYPTIEELTDNKLSERIKITIRQYITEANDILSNNNIDFIHYQMNEIYYRLKPYSNWDKQIMKLEYWQKNRH